MASGSCTRLVASVIIILLALEYSSNANGYEGNETERKLLRSRKTGKDVSPHRDAVDGISAVNTDRRKVIGGRKILEKTVLDEKPSNFPGKIKPHSLKKERQTQNHLPNAAAVPSSSTAGVFTSSVDKNVFSTKNNSHTTAYKDGVSKAFLEAAADEVANLMGRDYNESARPKRNPPTNNQEPGD